MLVSILALLNACTAQSLASDPLIVTTNVGTFRGTNSSTTVRNWRGIRFGQPTNGTLRFRPPQRAAITSSDVVVNATQYGLSCPQNRGANYQGFNAISNLGNATDGDDCLSLNIWAPAVSRLNSSTSGAAVMIWIYGGAFAFGTSNTPSYNANNFVRDQDDLIVVTINYRTNLFGFPVGTDALSPSQLNLGLMDQRLAVEWVYNNIRAFGGDPDRLTLFGESAGAASIGTWPYAYQYDPIVKGLILESGSEITLLQTAARNTTTRNRGWQTIATNSGCGLNSTTTAQEQLACMQALDFRVIQSAVSNYTGSGTFTPSIDNVTVFADYTSRLQTGQFAKIPLLVGNNDNEGTILTGLYPPGSVTATSLTLYGFTCPSALLAQSRTNASVPAWQYRYLGTYPSLNAIPALGVFHSSEIPLVFGTYNLSTIAPPTANLIATSSDIQGGWAAFAKDPTAGLTAYGWPVYRTNGSTLIELGVANTTEAIFANSTTYNAGCENPVILTRGN